MFPLDPLAAGGISCSSSARLEKEQWGERRCGGYTSSVGKADSFPSRGSLRSWLHALLDCTNGLIMLGKERTPSSFPLRGSSRVAGDEVASCSYIQQAKRILLLFNTSYSHRDLLCHSDRVEGKGSRHSTQHLNYSDRRQGRAPAVRERYTTMEMERGQPRRFQRYGCP